MLFDAAIAVNKELNFCQGSSENNNLQQSQEIFFISEPIDTHQNVCPQTVMNASLIMT
jgi:hypothetical protein